MTARLAESIERLEAMPDFLIGAIERDYAAQDARLAAQEFAAARRTLTGMLASLTAEDLARDGTFEGRRITVAGLVDMMLEHDRGRRAEIEALLRGAD